MSLLIKALDKAQAAKDKQGDKAKKSPSRKPKSIQANSLTEAGSLSLVEPDASLQQAAPKRQPKSFQPQSTQEFLLAELGDDTPVLASKSANLAPATQATNMAAPPFEISPATKPNQKSTQTNSPNNVPRQSAQKQGQDRAANVFSAKQAPRGNQNTGLLVLAGCALLALGGIGIYFYRALHQFDVPPPLAQAAPSVQANAAANNNLPNKSLQATDFVEQTPANQTLAAPEQTAQVDPPLAPTAEPAESEIVAEKTDKLKLAGSEWPVEDAPKKSRKASSVFGDAPDAPVLDAMPAKPRKTNAQSAMRDESVAIASSSASIAVSKSRSENAINPTLLRAYAAYQAGNDIEAHTLYKQVLQRDVRNTDALLGLGAIASRQGRDADAQGWYRKVLELEPRNEIAQAALLDNPTQTGDVNSESQLKNMIELAPADASLHAKLGNMYADQNQWAAAQQAYFEANRFNPSAENALNLAVSLDHLGKQKLALTYYQKALAKLAAGEASAIDRAAVEARVSAIQTQ